MRREQSAGARIRSALHADDSDNGNDDDDADNEAARKQRKGGGGRGKRREKRREEETKGLLTLSVKRDPRVQKRKETTRGTSVRTIKCVCVCVRVYGVYVCE